jgi:hypothetical protein
MQSVFGIWVFIFPGAYRPTPLDLICSMILLYCRFILDQYGFVIKSFFVLHHWYVCCKPVINFPSALLVTFAYKIKECNSPNKSFILPLLAYCRPWRRLLGFWGPTFQHLKESIDFNKIFISIIPQHTRQKTNVDLLHSAPRKQRAGSDTTNFLFRVLNDSQ